MILFWHNFLSQWYNAAAGSVLSSSIRIFILVTMSQSETWCCDYWPIRSHFILKWRSTKSIRQNIHEKYSLVDVVGCAVQVSIFTLVSDLTRFFSIKIEIDLFHILILSELDCEQWTCVCIVAILSPVSCINSIRSRVSDTVRHGINKIYDHNRKKRLFQ